MSQTFHGFRKRLLSGETLLGSMLTINSGAVAEIMALAGFDWLFIDGEHGPFDSNNLQLTLQATSHLTAGIVRVSSAVDETAIKQALDLGAAGIIAPQVSSDAEAAAVVRACRYPPLGVRGIGLSRAHEYGRETSQYLDQANELVTVVVQVENVQAVENVNSICAVDGIDCVLIGPTDLSASLGLLDQPDHPDLKQAIDHVIDACHKQNLRSGIFGIDASAVEEYMSKGVTMIVAGIDAHMLMRSCEGLYAELLTLTSNREG